MEDIYNQINKGKEEDDFNKKIEEIINQSKNNINQKIKLATEEILKIINKEKIDFQKIMKLSNLLPNISLNPPKIKNNINYYINLIFCILATLQPIAKFPFMEETKEILKRMHEKIDVHNFLKFFTNLIKDMRDRNIESPNFEGIHVYLTNYLDNYNNNNPGSLINSILTLIQRNIELITNNGDLRNIITNNFSVELITTVKCYGCGKHYQDKMDKQLVIDLFLKEPQIKDSKIKEELQSIFNPLLIQKNINLGNCSFCNDKKAINKSFKNLNNYLILNIDRSEDPKNYMNLIYSETLKLTDEKDKKDYKYQLVLALTNIDIKLTYEENIKNYVLVFKNFINDHWYQKTGETTEDMTKKIKDLSVQQLISEQKPNILIYKKINDNKDN